MTEPSKKSSPALVLLAWLVVSVPGGWGVYNTVLGSIRLFTETATTQPAAPVSVAPK
jgi:hypothetical protein